MKHVDINSIKHFGICFILSLIGLYGAAFALGCAVTKEWCDKLYANHWCWMDILFDVLGISSGIGLYYLLF